MPDLICFKIFFFFLFFFYKGASGALIFTVFGAAYGTAKSGVGISTMGVVKPELVMRSIIPVIFAGVVAIYGLIIAVIISTKLSPGGPLQWTPEGGGVDIVRERGGYTLYKGMVDLGGGLACGLAGLGAGMCIGRECLFCFRLSFSLCLFGRNCR